MRVHLAWITLAGLGLLGSGCSGPLATASPTPQRPTFSFDTNLTAAGTVELESGIAFEAGERFDTPSTLKIGITPSTELFVGFSPQRSTDVPGPNPRGAGDVLVGTRILFDDVADGWRKVGSLATRLPGGNAGDSGVSGESDFFMAGAIGRDFDGVGFTAFYQLGLIGDQADDSIFAEHTMALAAGLPIADQVSFFAEGAGVFRPDLDLNQLVGTFGAAWAWAPNVTLDAGLQLGLSDDAPDYQLLIGATWNLGGIPFAARNELPQP